MGRQSVFAEEAKLNHGIEGLQEYLWDGARSREEVEELAADIVERAVEAVNQETSFQWDPAHGTIWYDTTQYQVSDDAVADFHQIREEITRRITLEMEATLTDASGGPN